MTDRKPVAAISPSHFVGKELTMFDFLMMVLSMYSRAKADEPVIIIVD